MVGLELLSLFGLSSWCFVVGVFIFLAVPWVGQQFVIVVFPYHNHLYFLMQMSLCLVWFLRTLSRCLSGTAVGQEQT